MEGSNWTVGNAAHELKVGGRRSRFYCSQRPSLWLGECFPFQHTAGPQHGVLCFALGSVPHLHLRTYLFICSPAHYLIPPIFHGCHSPTSTAKARRKICFIFFPGNYLISARKKESTGDHSSLPTPSSTGMAPSSPLSSRHCSAGCPLHEPGPRGSQHPQASCPSAAPALLCCAFPLFLLPSDSILSCKTSAGCRITGCPHSRVETCRAEGLSISSQG